MSGYGIESPNAYFQLISEKTTTLIENLMSKIFLNTNLPQFTRESFLEIECTVGTYCTYPKYQLLSLRIQGAYCVGIFHRLLSEQKP